MVVHQGGAHGGHYTAYIRDADNLGQWSSPEEGSISVLGGQGSGQLDVIECDSPIELLQTILNDAPGKCLCMDRLGGVGNWVFLASDSNFLCLHSNLVLETCI